MYALIYKKIKILQVTTRIKTRFENEILDY